MSGGFSLVSVVSPVEGARAVLGRPQRQSFLGLVFELVDVLRRLGGFTATAVAGAVLLRQQSSWVVMFLLVGLAGVVAWSAAEWWKFVFWVDDDRLKISRGVIATQRQIIPLDRIQSVSIEQSAVHRVVGLVKVSVETAGAGADNLKVDALSQKVARSLQLLVEAADRNEDLSASSTGSANGASVRAATEQEEVVVSRSFASLFRGAAARAPYAGLVGLGSLSPFVGQLLPSARSTILSTSGRGLVGLVVVGGLLVWCFNIGQDIVRNWGLEVTRSRSGLRRTAGLVATTSSSTTIRRIQEVRTWQNPLERRWGIRRITLPTIGSGDLRVAGSSDAELYRLRELVLGQGDEWPPARSVSAWWLYRELRLVPVGVVAMVGAAIVWSPLALLIVPLLVWLSVQAYVSHRRFRWDVVGARLVVVRSFFILRRKEQRLIKVQSIVLRRSWLERRRGLASLVFVSAEGRTVIPMIDVLVAERCRDEVLMVLATDRSAWM